MLSPDEDQIEVLRNLDKRSLLITSPPGAGKTFTGVLIAREALRGGLLAAHQCVLFLTFSKNAQAQLNKETRRLITERRELSRVVVSNFHSFFWQYIRAYRTILGLPLSTELICEEDRYGAIKRFASPLAKVPAIDHKHMMHLSAALENTLVEGKNATFPSEWDRHLEPVAEFIRSENAEGRLHFDDLCFYFRVALSAPAISRALEAKYPIIIIDEFQDTSALQWHVIKSLAENGRLFVFADECQQLHEWRGASNKRLEDFDVARKPVKLELSHLHRLDDSPELQRVALTLRKALFKGGIEKVDLRAGVKCRIKTYDHLMFNKLKNTLYWAVRNEGERVASVAVLLPTNDLVNDLHCYFNRKGLFVSRISDGTDRFNFFSKVLRCAATANDRKDYADLILTVLQGLDRDNSLDLQKIQLRPLQDGSFSAQRTNPNSDRGRLLKILNTELLGACPSVIDCLARVIACRSQLESIFKLNHVVFRELSLITRSALRRLSKDQSQQNRISALLREEVARVQFLHADTAVSGRYVLTIHQAKGKEFDIVLLPYCLDRYFGEDQQDRMKFYVALTRAKKGFFIFTPDAPKQQSPLLKNHFLW